MGQTNIRPAFFLTWNLLEVVVVEGCEMSNGKRHLVIVFAQNVLLDLDGLHVHRHSRWLLFHSMKKRKDTFTGKTVPVEKNSCCQFFRKAKQVFFYY